MARLGGPLSTSRRKCDSIDIDEIRFSAVN